MARLPRDLTGSDLARLLSRLGYTLVHSRGSHMKLTTQLKGEHHVTIPRHDPLKIGTLNAILSDVAAHHGLGRDEAMKLLFGRT